MKGTLNHPLKRCAGLAAIALAELTWLAIRVEMPAAGLLSYLKGFPSIFMTSLAVVAVLGWIRFRGRLSQIAIFRDASHNPWPMILAHCGAFAVFSWEATRGRGLFYHFSLNNTSGPEHIGFAIAIYGPGISSTGNSTDPNSIGSYRYKTPYQLFVLQFVGRRAGRTKPSY